MSIFENNLRALAQVDKELENILRLTENEIFEVYLSENDKVKNANIVDSRFNHFLYPDNAASDIDAKLKKFEEYDNYPLLYFFGIGNGTFYKELLKNPKHQSIMLIEPEIELIFIALNLIDFSQEILEHRLVIKLSILVNKLYFINMLGDRSKFFLKSYNLHIYSNFYNKYKIEIKRVNKEIIEAFKYLMYSIGNSAEDSLIGLAHSLKNIPKMIQKPTLVQLFKKATNTKTAVLVSTGPSLEKQLPMLKKIQDYITILCIDASFPILAKNGIKPDIVISIERVPLTGDFYKNTPRDFHKGVIFALATVCHDETIDNIYGDISFFMRADGYNRFFEIDDWGYLGGGMSSANFAYDLAVASGFENIIFIGQDLSYAKDGRSHSKNHVFGEDEVSKNKIIGNVEAYGGEGEVATTMVWRAFLNSFKVQVKYASKVNSINCTEGGARIDGTLEMPFVEACHKYLDTNHKKEQIVLEKPSKMLMQDSLKKFREGQNKAIKIGKNMSKRANKVFKLLKIFLIEIQDYSVDEINDKVDFNILDELIDKITTIKEKYNDESFSKMYATLLLAYVASFEFKVSEVYVMRDHTDLAKKLKKIEWIKIHQEWLFRLVVNIDAIVKVIEENRDNI